jgi:hypothetical protein
MVTAVNPGAEPAAEALVVILGLAVIGAIITWLADR